MVTKMRSDIEKKITLFFQDRQEVIAVHEYGNIDLAQVYEICHQDIGDIECFVRAILGKCRIA